jgi:hypothetical protein
MGPKTPDLAAMVRRHLSFGWWSLLVFLLLGVTLEAMHGLKLGLYLDVSNSTRRLMWTLAHAHGALIALVHVAFAATLRALPPTDPAWAGIASPSLMAASVLLPGGFFLGGVFIYGGDPGLGILLVPVGALTLAVAVFLTARAASR